MEKLTKLLNKVIHRYILAIIFNIVYIKNTLNINRKTYI